VSLWVLAGIWRAWARRRAFRRFAEAHRLQFAGFVVPDARLPYSRFERLRWAVLLSNVLEGPWDGVWVAVFDMRKTRHSPVSAVQVRVENLLPRVQIPRLWRAESDVAGEVGPRAAAVLARRPQTMIEADFDSLLVIAERRLDASELPELLGFATALARALAVDSRES
jgi:hypothetical protein